MSIEESFSNELYKRFSDVGIKIPRILFPSKSVDLCKWAVIACDQHTSQPEYWDDVYSLIGDEPSTGKIVFPEVYLKDDGFDERISSINEQMNEYLKTDVLDDIGEGMILISRSVSNGERKGLLVAIDLEEYDYSKGSKSKVRATEETIVSRIPTRVKIRKNAPIETPHIMILINDPDNTVIEPIYKKCQTSMTALYDFDLMLEGGRQKAWQINDEETLSQIADSLQKLKTKNEFMYAMGDGNHSLATAKQHWENRKAELVADGASESDICNHPARYALVELVNLFDESLVFEPIHRIITKVDKEDFIKCMAKDLESKGIDVEKRFYLGQTGFEKMVDSFYRLTELHANQCFAFAVDGTYGLINMTKSPYRLTVGAVQAFLDDYLAEHKEAEIDYVHEMSQVKDMADQKGNFGIFLPPMDKQALFPTVEEEGALPRKTFSMGEACEKRYYIECRKITK